jgi:hypothetical protein
MSLEIERAECEYGFSPEIGWSHYRALMGIEKGNSWKIFQTATRDLQELVEKKVFKQYGTKGQGISYQLIGS